MSAVFVLGIEEEDSEAVHIVQGPLNTSALCGHYPIRHNTTGLREDQVLCESCFETVEALPTVPNVLLGRQREEA